METLKVSVIIAHDKTRGESGLNQCIASIHAQQSVGNPLGLEDVQILVADEGSKSASRNHAADQATGDILLFFDDDVRLRENCLIELLKPFHNPNVGIVGGVNIPQYSEDWRSQIASSLLSSPLTMFKSCARYTPRGNLRATDESEVILCNMAIRKTVFLQAGQFPLDVIPCEENVLINHVQQLGFTVMYNPFAVVYHERPRLFLPYWRKIWNYGRGRGVMMRKYKTQGLPKMFFWTSPFRLVAYVIAFVGHWLAYPLGVLYGLVCGN